MELKKAIKILSLHNRWRKGEPLKMQEPELIGDSIDVILNEFKKQRNRFDIDFFEFSFLVEACIPPRPIARAMFWENVIDKYYNVLTLSERDRLFEWVNRNNCFEERLKENNEDCLLFNARYDKSNQFLVTTNYKKKIEIHNAFKWKGKYHLSKTKSINEKYIVSVVANGS